MSKRWSLAGLLFVLLTTTTIASAQNGAREVTHMQLIHRGRSFLQNAPPRELAPERMKPPREADRKRDLIKAMRQSMTCMRRRQAPPWNVPRQARMRVC